jgi:hypothetical protein
VQPWRNPEEKEIPMKTEPQKEHEWLQRLVGEWTYESDCSMEPGKPPEKFEGSESVPHAAQTAA